MSTAKLVLEGKEHELPVVVGSEGEVGIDISKLRDKTGAITLDDGYGNTGSCKSAITFIDGDKGILRYRGYPIEDLEQARFTEVAFLLIYGHLPNKQELAAWREKLTRHSLIHEDMKKFFEGFSPNAHPMAILSAMVASFSTYYSEADDVDLNIVRLLAKAKTVAAFSYKKSIGQPFMYPINELSYTENFLHMMFAVPCEPYKVNSTLAKALDRIFILHADHEQNASTSTVRLVGSTGASPYAAIAAGIAALWGPAHGGANEAVVKMLAEIGSVDRIPEFIEKAKDKDSHSRLMGFGHRVYRNYDPRAGVLKESADEVLGLLGQKDNPKLAIARELERIALNDDYFAQRKLFPNVDFYSGIILEAMGIPTTMFTAIFALARTVGWIAQWSEMIEDPEQKIGRPRQRYTGYAQRSYVPIEQR